MPNRKPRPSTPHLAMTVEEFCEAFRISKGFYYSLRNQGLGPREIKLGARTIISMAAANEWIAAREDRRDEHEQKAS
jgi:predicted DNA-binding transcriptional regulator AlpA